SGAVADPGEEKRRKEDREPPRRRRQQVPDGKERRRGYGARQRAPPLLEPKGHVTAVEELLGERDCGVPRHLPCELPRKRHLQTERADATVRGDPVPHFRRQICEPSPEQDEQGPEG